MRRAARPTAILANHMKPKNPKNPANRSYAAALAAQRQVRHAREETLSGQVPVS